jgi:membrane-associated phospholipid phosphatase
MPSHGLSLSVFADVGGLVTELLTLAFIVSACIPSLHQRARAIVQPFVIYHVESGLYWVRLFQRYRTDAVTLVADTLCHTVSVPFYGVSLPIIMWMNPYLGTHMTLLMAITQYTGNAMKDLVSAPRPSSLKYAEVRIAQTRAIAVNEKEKELNAAEYGFPSSHAMNSLAYNFYLAAALHKYGSVSDGAASYWYAGVMIFVCTVAVSRVYLGLHTPIDILGGAVAGLAVVTAYSRLQWAWGLIDVFLYSGLVSWRLVAAGLASLLLLRMHPTPESHTPSYGTSCSDCGRLRFGLLRIRRGIHCVTNAPLLCY